MAKNYQLRNIPEDVQKIITAEQGKKLQEQNRHFSKEFVIYKIIREWSKSNQNEQNMQKL